MNHRLFNHTLLFALISLNAIALLGQAPSQTANFNVDCSTDFWTITSTGYIQQWALSGGAISGGDTVLSGGGQSIAFCGDSLAPTFFTDNWNPGGFGINYYHPDSGWLNIPNTSYMQDNGGHLHDQYYTVVGGVIQYVTHWDGTNSVVIDSLPGEFFAGIFDIGVDTEGHAWVFTASSPGTAIDSLKVYDPGGQINSYPFQYDIYGYGSFFLNETLYLGTFRDSIFPILLSGNTAQLGIGIPFPSGNFTDMASCQRSGTSTSLADPAISPIKLFPNPTTGLLMLPPDIVKSKVAVCNSTGQFVAFKLSGNQLDLSEQPPGIYYLKIDTAGRPVYSKVVKY